LINFIAVGGISGLKVEFLSIQLGLRHTFANFQLIAFRLNDCQLNAMNEAETRAELIDPKLRANGWGVVEGSKILRERNVCKITDGRIQVGGNRKKPLIADYILNPLFFACF
jgi:hypothetical protein